MSGGALEAVVLTLSGDYIFLSEADKSCGSSPQGKNTSVHRSAILHTDFVGVHWPPTLSIE